MKKHLTRFGMFLIIFDVILSVLYRLFKYQLPGVQSYIARTGTTLFFDMVVIGGAIIVFMIGVSCLFAGYFMKAENS